MPIRQRIVRTIACDRLWKVELPKKPSCSFAQISLRQKDLPDSRKSASQPMELGFTNDEQGVALNQSFRIAPDRIADYKPSGATT